MTFSAAILKPRLRNSDPYAANVVSLKHANDADGTNNPSDMVAGVTWTPNTSATYGRVVYTKTLVAGGSYRCTSDGGSSGPTGGVYSAMVSQFASNTSSTYEVTLAVQATTKVSLLGGTVRGNTNVDWHLVFNRGFSYLGGLDFAVTSADGSSYTYTSLGFTPVAGVPFKFRVSSVYSSGSGLQTHYVFIDGVLKATVVNPTARHSTGRAFIGDCFIEPQGSPASKLSQEFYWDEFRFTKDIARSTTNYTPDSGEFLNP